jgi:fucose 4-O-acetylase-like acetyltransferase
MNKRARELDVMRVLLTVSVIFGHARYLSP